MTTRSAPSFIVRAFTSSIEFSARWLTVSGLFFKKNRNIFMKIEVMMLTFTVLSIFLLFIIDKISYAAGLVISIFLIQRVFEYFVVYSRNFILNRGRVFTNFPNEVSLGEWLILMFFVNMIQVMLVFATWYRFISFHSPQSFSVGEPLGVLDSLYFGTVTFFTVGFGDIVPMMPLTKILAMLQIGLTFYTIVIVINGLISIHFRNRDDA
jgi:hypothetical protein